MNTQMWFCDQQHYGSYNIYHFINTKNTLQALGSLSTPSASSNQLLPSRRESMSTQNTLSVSSARHKSPEPPVNQIPQSIPSRSPVSPGSPFQRPSISPPPSAAFNPLVYGNDVDSVDVATRVAMVLKGFKNLIQRDL